MLSSFYLLFRGIYVPDKWHGKADDTSVDEEEDGEPFAHIVDQDATGRAPVRKQDLKHRRQKKKKLVGELRLVAAEIQPRGATLKS